MRIAVFGDIHANLEALEAVLADAREQKCDRYLCLGDVVGYGASPRECIARVRGLDCPVLRGNHDEQAGIDDSLEGFSPLSEEALNWTRLQLTTEERSWLRDLPYGLVAARFEAVHATLKRPERWGYIFNRLEAWECMENQQRQVCFIGHTHLPAFYTAPLASGPFSRLVEKFDRQRSSCEQLAEPPAGMKTDSKYLLNAGSVGQPRDGDPRASYLIFDDELLSVVLRRVSYDILGAQSRILAAGLPKRLADRLLWPPRYKTAQT